MCTCVFFPFILDIKFVGRTSRGHTGGRSHRIISHPPSFCGACIMFIMYGHAYSKRRNQPGKVANPACGQLNRENEYFLVRVRSRLRMWSRETGSAVPSRVSLLISILRLNLVLAYLRDSSRFPRRRRPFIYFIPPLAIGSVPSLCKCVPMAFIAESTPAQCQ